MTLRDLKLPVFLGLSFAGFGLLRRSLGIEMPQWFSILSVVAVCGLVVTVTIYGRKRQSLSDEYLARRDSAPKFEDDFHRSSIDDLKDDI
jgi:hypothetical protein